VNTSQQLLESAKAEAKRLLQGLPRRWAHVQTVGRVAESLVAEASDLPEVVAIAAWLHDIGYSPDLVETGLHPLDGARHLAATGWPDEVVRLVAHHTGASYEAEERGLVAELSCFPSPDPASLDALCLADLTTGPDGSRVSVEARLAEILTRYEPSDPVHRAITRSTPSLRAAAARAALASDSTDEWCRAAVIQGVLDP